MRQGMCGGLGTGDQEQRTFAPDGGFLVLVPDRVLLGQHRQQVHWQICCDQTAGTLCLDQFDTPGQGWLQKVADQLAPRHDALVQHFFAVARRPLDGGGSFEPGHQLLQACAALWLLRVVDTGQAGLDADQKTAQQRHQIGVHQAVAAARSP